MEGIIEGINTKLESLVGEAKRICDHYWRKHLACNRGKAGGGKSVLGVRVKKALGGQGCFYVEWFHNAWVSNGEGGRKPISQYIKRGAGHQYTKASLTRYAKEWEIKMVLDLEKQFGLIRQTAYHLVRARDCIRAAARAQTALTEECECL